MEQHDPLISKPVSRWTPEDVVSWMDSIGPWAQLYRDRFQQENVNGRYATQNTLPVQCLDAHLSCIFIVYLALELLERSVL